MNYSFVLVFYVFYALLRGWHIIIVVEEICCGVSGLL